MATEGGDVFNEHSPERPLIFASQIILNAVEKSVISPQDGILIGRLLMTVPTTNLTFTQAEYQQVHNNPEWILKSIALSVYRAKDKQDPAHPNPLSSRTLANSLDDLVSDSEPQAISPGEILKKFIFKRGGEKTAKTILDKHSRVSVEIHRDLAEFNSILNIYYGKRLVREILSRYKIQPGADEELYYPYQTMAELDKALDGLIS